MSLLDNYLKKTKEKNLAAIAYLAALDHLQESSNWLQIQSYKN